MFKSRPNDPLYKPVRYGVVQQLQYLATHSLDEGVRQGSLNRLRNFHQNVALSHDADVIVALLEGLSDICRES